MDKKHNEIINIIKEKLNLQLEKLKRRDMHLRIDDIWSVNLKIVVNPPKKTENKDIIRPVIIPVQMEMSIELIDEEV